MAYPDSSDFTVNTVKRFATGLHVDTGLKSLAGIYIVPLHPRVSRQHRIRTRIGIPDAPVPRSTTHLTQRMYFAKANMDFPPILHHLHNERAMCLEPQHHEVIIQPIRQRFILPPREAAGSPWQGRLEIVLQI